MSAHHNPKLKLGENEMVLRTPTGNLMDRSRTFARASLACRSVG